MYGIENYERKKKSEKFAEIKKCENSKIKTKQMASTSFSVFICAIPLKTVYRIEIYSINIVKNIKDKRDSFINNNLNEMDYKLAWLFHIV